MTDAPIRWRKSSYSGTSSECVEVGRAGGDVLVRNSNDPDAGTLRVSRPAMASWLAACRTGDLDALTA